MRAVKSGVVIGEVPSFEAARRAASRTSTPGGTACACSRRSCTSGWSRGRRHGARRTAGESEARRSGWEMTCRSAGLTASGGHPSRRPPTPRHAHRVRRRLRVHGARWGDLVAAVASWPARRPAPLEIVVVVDHNPAAARAGAARASERGRRRQRRSRADSSGARNSGVVAAAAATWSPSSTTTRWPQPGWLEQPAARLRRPGGDRRRRHGRAVCGPRTRRRGFPAEFDWVVGCTYRGCPQERSPVRNLIGANMSFRRDGARCASGTSAPDLGRVGTRPVGLRGDRAVHPRLPRRGGGDDRVRARGERPATGCPPSARAGATSASRCYAEGRSKALVARLRRREPTDWPPSAPTCADAAPRCGSRRSADALLRRDLAGLRAGGRDRRRPGDHDRRLRCR